LDRQLTSPQMNSDIVVCPSSIKNTRFSRLGGIIIGSDSNDHNNLKLHKAGIGFLDICLGDDASLEGSFSYSRAFLNVKELAIGTSSNQDYNLKFHRAGDGILQLIPASDNTLDGVMSPNNVTIPGFAPIGSILSWIPGYFIDGNNSTYNNVLSISNTASGANIYLNPLGWYVCDGSAVNDSSSPIFNGIGKYLPNLTDNRFLEGMNVGGVVGGTNTAIHTHNATPDISVVTQPAVTIPGHYHGITNLSMGGDSSHHYHGVTVYGNSDTLDWSAHTSQHTYTAHTLQAGLGSALPGNDHYYNAGQQNSDTDPGSSNHSHSISGSFSLSTENTSHYHSVSGYGGNYPGGADGDNTLPCAITQNTIINNPTVISGPPSQPENRPQYLNCFFIFRIK